MAKSFLPVATCMQKVFVLLAVLTISPFLSYKQAVCQSLDINNILLELSFCKKLPVNVFFNILSFLIISIPYWVFHLDEAFDIFLIISFLINKPSLYPNPLSKNDNLTINVPKSWDNSTLVIYNMLGQKVIQASLNIGENLLKLNTNTGIYNVVIFNSKQKLTTNFQIMIL